MSKSASLKMYKVLDEDNASYLNFAYHDCEAFYREPGAEEWQALSLSKNGSATENIYSIEGEDNWNPETCEVRLVQEITLHNLRELFKTETGSEPLMPVALEQDVLGITAVWWSDKSQIRGCQYIGEIRYMDVVTDGDSTYTLDMKFPAGQLAGQLEVFYKLYMKEPGEKRMPGFAHDSGVILGDIGTSLILQIDGEGAMFPVSTVSADKEPLWWTEINIDDPFEDSFTEEYFCLVLNDAHPDYKELKKRSGAFSALYHEVFASALEELFIVLRRDFGEKFDAMDLTDVVPGTIAHAAIYMIKTFDIQMDADITTLHTSVRKAVYKQLKGATKG